MPIAPDSVRRKFDSPDALASRSSEMLDSVIVVIGTKKHATPIPCTSRGRITWLNGTSSVNVEFQIDTPANTMNAKLATIRRSSRCMLRPISGDSTSASSPTGAVARPALPAV